MARATLLASLALVAASFAGCLGGDEPVGPAVTEENDSLNVVPPEGRGPIIAFEETNATETGVGGVDHHHDMWNGASRVVMFETSASMYPLATYNADSYVAEATFKPPLGTLVYEGTASVEFTISNPERRPCLGEFTLGGEFVCTDNLNYHTGNAPDAPRAPDPTGGPAGLKLRYKHSSTTQWIDVGELTWGTALPIQILDPRDTDMPHATSSLWEFQVVSPNQQDSTLTFTAKAEIVRADGDIPLWPGHPDFYADGKHYRTVLERTGAVAGDPGQTPGMEVFMPEGAGPVISDKLISYGTRTLHVWINVTDFQMPSPALKPDSFFLFHWNATGRSNITDPFGAIPLTQTSLYWALPVDDNGMDSPYADGSRWQFQIGAAMNAGIACYSGCASWTAKYDIKIVASDIVLPEEEYHIYCLDDRDCPPPADDGGGR